LLVECGFSGFEKKKKKKNPKRKLITLYPNIPVHLSSDGVVAMHVFY
jgi:hypothetical protein